MSLISKIDTKKEAFKLVHDPVKLLSLLYLKYGDIEEEYYISFTNKLIFNTPCRFNAIFKECQFFHIFILKYISCPSAFLTVYTLHG